MQGETKKHFINYIIDFLPEYNLKFDYSKRKLGKLSRARNWKKWHPSRLNKLTTYSLFKIANELFIQRKYSDDIEEAENEAKEYANRVENIIIPGKPLINNSDLLCFGGWSID